ncbi:MAG: hypothetical protein PGN07_09975 [Aeromicrobium erythreum]
MSDVDAVVRRLYGLRPEDFTAARDTAAAELTGADRTRVKQLRKPTLAAWAVNRVARERPDVVEALADLGDRMRDAQADGDGAALRELEKERRATSRTAVAAAVQVTGLAASAGAMEGVTASLRAVALDPDAAQAVLAGCLDRPLEASGFGATGIAPTRRAAPRRSTTDRLAAAREAVTEATEALDRAPHGARRRAGRARVGARGAGRGGGSARGPRARARAGPRGRGRRPRPHPDDAAGGTRRGGGRGRGLPRRRRSRA